MQPRGQDPYAPDTRANSYVRETRANPVAPQTRANRSAAETRSNPVAPGIRAHPAARETRPQPRFQPPRRRSGYRGGHEFVPYQPPASGSAGDERMRWERERRLLEEDYAYTQRQLSGLVALMSIAEPETVVVPFSGPMVRLRYTGPLERVDESPLAVPGEAGATGRAGKLGALLRSDKMLRNALYIVLNSGLQAALGFGFWIITARVFSTENVGRASTLISATGLLSFLGLLGLNTTLIRYLPVAASRNRLMTASITVTAFCSGLAALIYVFLTPSIAPSVSFIAHSVPLTIGFVLITAAAAVNVLTDSIFIAVGKSSYNAVVDGAIGGTFRIVLLVVLVGGGAFTVFGIASAGYVAAAAASLVLMTRVLRWRPDFRDFWQVLRPVLKFSGANYVGSILNLLPSLVVPLIVINRLGPSTEAYYYVAFQLAALLYTATSAVEQAFLAEGAGSQGMNKAVLLRSLRILLAFCVPSFLVILFFGHYALLAFGPKYDAHAQGCLIALAAAVLPIAADNWFLTVLRLSNRLKAIVWSNGVYGAVVVALAWILAPHGLTAVALSWPIGSSAGALVAGVAAIGALRRNQGVRQQNSPVTAGSHNRLRSRCRRQHACL